MLPSSGGGGGGGGDSSNGQSTHFPFDPTRGVISHRGRPRKSARIRDHLKNKEKVPVHPATPYDAAYFHSYAHLGVHEEMIKDRTRTETYRAAILQHQSCIEGKVIMDVGCGTGILSIFCALAGAKKVYAVDASEIALQASKVVEANNLTEKIQVLHGRVEDIHINEEIDVIISEWMGYMLLYESMLSSVITARDRWLKPGGLILPSHATVVLIDICHNYYLTWTAVSALLYMAPVTNSERYSESIDFWRNVYGIDMSAMLPLAKQCAFEEPSVEFISGENVLTWPFVVKDIDCYTVTIHELEHVTADYKFSSMMQAPFHGFAFWFDVEFAAPTVFINNHVQVPQENNVPSDISLADPNQKKRRSKSIETLVLSTAPEEAPTHWQQALLYFYDPIEVKQDQTIQGSVTLSQSKENPRFLNIHLEYTSGGRAFVKDSVMR